MKCYTLSVKLTAFVLVFVLALGTVAGEPSVSLPGEAHRARELLDHLLEQGDNNPSLLSDELRHQINLGRFTAMLQQDIDIATQLQELVDRLHTLRPHARGLNALLADVHGTERLRTVLEHLVEPDSQTPVTDSSSQLPKLVYLSSGKSAIFEYGAQYHLVAVGGELNAPSGRYVLVSLDEHEAMLRNPQGETLYISLAEDTHD